MLVPGLTSALWLVSVRIWLSPSSELDAELHNNLAIKRSLEMGVLSVQHALSDCILQTSCLEKVL